MFEESTIYKQTRYWGIPIIGISLTFIMNDTYELFTLEHAFNTLIFILITGIFSVTISSIVKTLWKKYPWHLNPLKHLILEILLVLLLIIVLLGIIISTTIFFIPVDWEIFGHYAIITVLVTFLLVSIYEAIFFFIQWTEHIKKSEFLEKSNIESQYELLKSQVNPHFLFNSLNTLHSQLDNNKEAQVYIENLSSFLRYGFSNKQAEVMNIENELEIVNKYIELQKTRFGSGIHFKTQIDPKYLTKEIPTFSLQMLVENCIKHNIVSQIKPLKINIYTENDQYFIVRNNLQLKEGVNSNKQGLSNIKERYRFLSSKSIFIEKDKGYFTVKLPLLNPQSHD